MSGGKFYADSIVWAKIPRGGPALEAWRGFHQPHGTPHPPSALAPALVLELMPRIYERFRDTHAVVWACEGVVHVGLVIFVTFPRCSRCAYRSYSRSM